MPAHLRRGGKEIFEECLINGFSPRNFRRGICLAGKWRKENPPAEEFRHVIAERDSEAVETRGKNFIAGFVFRERMGIEKSAEKNWPA